jgi:hypothetical protein
MMNSFIDTDPEGKLYMGIEMMDGAVHVRLFLGYVDIAAKNVATICDTLNQTVRDLQEQHLKQKKASKLLVATGEVTPNGIRPTEGRIKPSEKRTG